MTYAGGGRRGLRHRPRFRLPFLPVTRCGDRLRNGEHRASPNPPRPLCLGLESAGAKEVGGVGRRHRLAKREAQTLRFPDRDASGSWTPARKRSGSRPGARAAAGLSTQARSSLLRASSSPALVRRRLTGSGTREAGPGFPVSGATNGRGGDSYRFRGSGCRGGRRRPQQGGSHRRDPRHGSADLEQRKLPARCRAGETVLGWKWKALRRRMGKIEAQNIDGEGPQADEWEEWRRRILKERNG